MRTVKPEVLARQPEVIPLDAGHTTYTGDGLHAPLPPSGYDWWWNCRGVLRLPECLPIPAGPAAVAGTEGHAIAEGVLRNHCRWTSELTKKAYALGEDYVLAIGEYVAYIAKGVASGARLYIEERVFPLGGGPTDLVHGTADAMLDHEFDNVLEVVDLKLGAGFWVGADSMQLKIYALGGLQRIMRDTPGRRIKQVKATIVQPRCPRPEEPTTRTATYDAAELILDFEYELRQVVLSTQKADAPLNPGDHCRWCPRKARCPAQRKLANEIIAADFKVVASKGNGTAKVRSPQERAEMGLLLDKLDRIDAWSKGLREEALQLAIAGTAIPGRKLVIGDTHRKFKPEVLLDSTALCVATGLSKAELMEDPKLCSPAQLEKKAGKGVDLTPFTFKPPGSPKLVPEFDKRTSLNDANDEIVAKDFKQVTL